jgi:CreA protein
MAGSAIRDSALPLSAEKLPNGRIFRYAPMQDCRNLGLATRQPQTPTAFEKAPMILSILRPVAAILIAIAILTPRCAGAEDPDLIFRKSTVFHFLTPNDKLATYALDDPAIDGVACYFTVPEKGGVAGTLGLAEQVSDISLACRQYGPVKFKEKFSQGDVVFRERRSLFFKKMQIVRGCDKKRNVLVYMVYSDKLIEGSPKNSTSTVAVQPWGASAPKCADWVND